jgi:Ca-activated chloride channel homolog
MREHPTASRKEYQTMATDESIIVQVEGQPEGRLVFHGGGARHVDFAVRVSRRLGVGQARPPLALALVLDRSGSMQGDKLVTAKRAAQAVLDRLDERDQAAVVVFDSTVDVVHPLTPVTTETKARIRAALSDVQARASTALHEGWLTGCRAIAERAVPGVARCFLLTDGLANLGVTDPEQIATEAAGIREHAGIGTSTFGIGPDYDEGLLGPMAVAGGGQMHHLRTATEIASTFIGELGELMAVAASRVQLEIEPAPGTQVSVVSAYWATRSQPAPNPLEPARWTVGIGDLLEGEERHVVVLFGCPALSLGHDLAVRYRVRWNEASGGEAHETAWQTLAFQGAAAADCDAEAPDPQVMHWVGLHQADRARREAAAQNRRGDVPGALRTLAVASQQIAKHAGQDDALRDAVDELRAVSLDSAAPMPSMTAKELAAESYRRSRGQRDLRKRT